MSPGFVILAAFVALVILAGGWGEFRRAGVAGRGLLGLVLFHPLVSASAPILIADGTGSVPDPLTR